MSFDGPVIGSPRCISPCPLLDSRECHHCTPSRPGPLPSSRWSRCQGWCPHGPCYPKIWSMWPGLMKPLCSLQHPQYRLYSGLLPLRVTDGTCFHSYLWIKLIPAVSVAPGWMIAKRIFLVGPMAIITLYINVIQTGRLCLQKRLKTFSFSMPWAVTLVTLFQMLILWEFVF